MTFTLAAFKVNIFLLTELAWAGLAYITRSPVMRHDPPPQKKKVKHVHLRSLRLWCVCVTSTAIKTCSKKLCGLFVKYNLFID